MAEKEPEWWIDPLPELARKLYLLSKRNDLRETEVTIPAALFQARVAWEGAKDQKTLIRWLVLGTWALVAATLIVAVKTSG